MTVQGKKGVEAESVTIGTVGEKTYAFIGLERIGGVMAYDITNPDKILWNHNINSQDFSKDIAGAISGRTVHDFRIGKRRRREMLICLHPAKCQEQLLLTTDIAKY